MGHLQNANPLEPLKRTITEMKKTRKANLRLKNCLTSISKEAEEPSILSDGLDTAPHMIPGSQLKTCPSVKSMPSSRKWSTLTPLMMKTRMETIAARKTTRSSKSKKLSTRSSTTARHATLSAGKATTKTSTHGKSPTRSRAAKEFSKTGSRRSKKRPRRRKSAMRKTRKSKRSRK